MLQRVAACCSELQGLTLSNIRHAVLNGLGDRICLRATRIHNCDMTHSLEQRSFLLEHRALLTALLIEVAHCLAYVTLGIAHGEMDLIVQCI